MKESQLNKSKFSKFAKEGTISKITDKGFGFISREEEQNDLFFHSNELIDVSFDELRIGDLVGFEIVVGSKGQTAINIGRDFRKFDDDEIDDDEIDIGEEVRLAIESLSSQLAVMIAKNPAALEYIEWRDLERLIAEVFSGLGFDAELTPSSKDGGKDVVVICKVSNETRSYAVEIKHWRLGNRVGNGVIMEFLHVIARENRNGGLFLATGGYCDNAFENLTEIDRQKLRFGTDEKVVSLCRNYVRAQEGIWSPPKQLDEVVFKDTVF